MRSSALRALEGFSLAAARTWLTRGTRAARFVVGETVRAAAESERRVNFWDLARGFAVNESVVIPSGSWEDGGTSPLERYLLALLIRYFKPASILEIGTFRGISTRLILENSSAPTQVYTMDLPPERDFSQLAAGTDKALVLHSKVGVEFQDHPERARVTQILGNSLEANTWATLPERIDFAFIDASHSYEAVKNDTERAREKLKPGAVIVWHDYTAEDSYERDVGRYIREQMRSHKNIFVVPSTSLAIQIPQGELESAGARISKFFHAGDFATRRPGGFAPWLNQ